MDREDKRDFRPAGRHVRVPKRGVKMPERSLQDFVERFLRQRSLPIPKTMRYLRKAKEYHVVSRQLRAGASDRVLTMLLERALK